MDVRSATQCTTPDNYTVHGNISAQDTWLFSNPLHNDNNYWHTTHLQSLWTTKKKEKKAAYLVHTDFRWILVHIPSDIAPCHDDTCSSPDSCHTFCYTRHHSNQVDILQWMKHTFCYSGWTRSSFMITMQGPALLSNHVFIVIVSIIQGSILWLNYVFVSKCSLYVLQ